MFGNHNREAFKNQQRQEQNRQALLHLARACEQSSLGDPAVPRDEKALQAKSDLDFNWLIARGADLNFSDATRQLPVVVAMDNQNKHIFNRIVQHESFNIEAIDVPSQLTILAIAAHHQDPYYQRSLQHLLSEKKEHTQQEEALITFSYNSQRINTYVQPTHENSDSANPRRKNMCCIAS